MKKGGEPILRVQREEADGSWLCLCDGEHSDEELRLAARVRWSDVRSQDPSLRELMDLPEGGRATRTGPDARWQRSV